MRRLALTLITVMTLTGCSFTATVPSEPSPPSPELLPPIGSDLPLVPAKPPAPSSPQPSTQLAVHVVGNDFELTGLNNPVFIGWSPSGLAAVVKTNDGWHLLHTHGPILERLPAFDPVQAPVFWSESELLSLDGGRLHLRDLTTGRDGLLHDFGAPVVHFLRPGDTHYVVNKDQGIVQQGYRFGTIVTGELGGQDETVLIETGHLIGRMANGQVLAVQGYRGGPLWAFSSTGERRLLSEEDAYFVEVSPDGKQALWLTHTPRKWLWLDLFKPAVAYADAPYDPPLTDLWIYNGIDDPMRIPLGGTFSARTRFSPDGTYIALALNEAIMTDAYNPEELNKPGHLAVIVGNEVRPLATFDGRVALGMWLGSDGFQFSPPAEKTGAQAPIYRIDLAAEQAQFSGGIWYQAGTQEGRSLIVNWKGDVTTVHWSDSARAARVEFDPNENLGHPWYVPPSSPYLPFVLGDRMVLKLLTR